MTATRGFTLIEMATVLFVLGLLLGSLFGPLGDSMELARRRQTANALLDIRESLIGFAVANGRLPCPAHPELPASSAGAGIETGALPGAGDRCAIPVGDLPWATLGLRELDAWGRRFTYRVTGSFADFRGGAGIHGETDLENRWDPCLRGVAVDDPRTFMLCSRGDIDVTRNTDGFAVAVRVPAVVVSHGRNGRGAFLGSGTQMLPGSGDELTNLGKRPPVEGGYQFVSRYDPDNADFDDMVTWVPLPLLLGRMVSAGRLP